MPSNKNLECRMVGCATCCTRWPAKFSILFFAFFWCLLFPSGLSPAQEPHAKQDSLIAQLESHAVNKQKVLGLLEQSPKLETTQCFATDYRQIRQHIIIDGEYQSIGKRAFLENAARKCLGRNNALFETLRELLKSHQNLFGSGENADLMVRSADDPAFKPYGFSLNMAEAMARMTEGNDAEVQAFQTIFETGQNTRGYVHKLECHATVVEFVYAVTDIVYGVMLPGDLEFGTDRVDADPTKVRLFFVPAGQVIALHPYVLHSGSLSVEADRSFSVIIYKKPVADSKELVIRLPEDWTRRQELIKIADVDKYYLTLAELHTPALSLSNGADLKTNRGYITDKKPLRLPVGK